MARSRIAAVPSSFREAIARKEGSNIPDARSVGSITTLYVDDGSVSLDCLVALCSDASGPGCIMMWQKERDLLIAQTMAFVQSVGLKPLDADRLLAARLPSMSSDQLSAAARPVDVLPTRLSPISQSDLRDDIRRRVAAFRARQQVFDRDRDEYCNAMMAKARASSAQATKARGPQLPKD
jgi:hypothetical protein